MRSFIVMAMFVASFANAAWNEFTEVRELNQNADGINKLVVKAGAGSMDIRGVAGLDKIVVNATVVVPDADEEDAVQFLEKKMRLSLNKNGGQAKLDPTGIDISIEDGAGSIDISDVSAAVSIDDGSGSIELKNATDIRIDDGSGSIDIANASGDVSIVDGSGSITVRSVGGSVTIDDGSGGIDVSDVERDLIIVDDGSGGFKFSNVRGQVEQDS